MFICANLFSLISNISLRSTLCTIIITLIFKYFIDKCRRDQRLEKFAQTLPGPFALPIIGNGADFVLAGLDGISNLLKKYSEKYGSTYRLWLGKHLVVAMSDVNDLEVVFRHRNLLGKPKLFQPYSDFWGNGLLTAPVGLWKTNRKRLQPVFAKNVVKLQMSSVNKSIENYMKLIDNHADGPEFDISTYLWSSAFDSIVDVHFDLDFNWSKNKYFSFFGLMKLIDKNGLSKIFMPWPRVKLIEDLYFGKLLESCKAGLKQCFQIPIADEPAKYYRESSSETTQLETVSKSFLSTVNALEKESQVEDLMHDEILLTIATAVDTISTTNSFLLLAISINAEIQDKLYSEIFDVFGDNDRPADIQDIERLSYLDQVVKETERRFTLTPLIFRDVQKDCQIGSLTVPAGTAIMIRIGDVHQNPDFYPNPHKFNPDNFSPEAVKKRSKYSFIPFSAGTRDCIGKNYANAAIKFTIVALLRKYSFYTTTKIEDIKPDIGYVVTIIDKCILGVKLRDRLPSNYKKKSF